MSDFFGDLEHELRAAHRRDAGRPLLARLRPSTPRVRTMAALGVAAALLIAAIGLVSVIADTAPERGVVQGDPPAGGPVPDHDGKVPGGEDFSIDPPQPHGACEGGGRRRGDEPPGELVRELAVFGERGQPGYDYTFDASVTQFFTDYEQTVTIGANNYAVVPALVDDRCDGDDLEPAACIGRVLRDKDDVRLGCVTLASLRARGLLVRETGGDGAVAYGLVPDGVTSVILQIPGGADGEGTKGADVAVQVHGNVFEKPLARSAAGVDLLEIRRARRGARERQNLHAPDTAP